jgi:predicted enzyme related to lactoylglutathione lyase
MTGFGAVDEHGAWTWSELMTDDLDASVEFYSELFGWLPTTSLATSQEYREMQLAGKSIAGIMPRPEGMPKEIPCFWGIYLSVDSLDTALDVVKARGGHVAAGPMKIEPGTFAQVVDPQGAMIGLLQPNG